MPVLEVARVVLELAKLFAELAEGRDGDEAERAASAALVGAVMHHAAFELVRGYRRAGESAAITSTRSSFTLKVGRASVQVEAKDEGLGFFFDGDLWGIVPILDRYQDIPVPALTFEDAIRMGRELVTRVGAVLEAARKQHAAT